VRGALEVAVVAAMTDAGLVATGHSEIVV